MVGCNCCDLIDSIAAESVLRTGAIAEEGIFANMTAPENIAIRTKTKLKIKSSTSPVGDKSSVRKLGTNTNKMQAMEEEEEGNK